MGAIARLEGPTLGWARTAFARYYASATIPPPLRFARREVAVFPFASETMMRRHASFGTAEQFRTFLAREVPRHAYYSSAYYRTPDHPKMAEKGWLGADLIFDLDADHLRGAEALDYEGQLALVKDRVRDLLDDFLFGDFGIDPDEAQLVFSGGRGYHIHVRSDAFVDLASAERRELVEYVMGTGFDGSTVIDERREDGGANDGTPGESGRTGARLRPFKRLYPPEEPGWRGRTTRGFLRLLSRWEEAGAASAAAEMERFGATPAEARQLARLLITQKKGAAIRATLSLEVFKRGVPQPLLDVVLRQAAVEVQGETDAPVTTDVHRLIRLPNSLHGGTGFRVLPLRRDELDGFDPLRDAPIAVTEGDPTMLEFAEPLRVRVGDERIEAGAGDRVTLGPAAALFAILRGSAALPSSPAP